MDEPLKIDDFPLNDNEKEPSSEQGQSKSQVNSYDTDVLRVAQQAQQVYQEKEKRWKTYFYKVVLGGNVKVAKDVIECINENVGTEILEWLLDTRDKNSSLNAPVKSKSILRLCQLMMFLLFAIVSTFLTPIFFAIHGLCVSIFTRRMRRLAANIKLPLAYAAFSQNDDMLRLFLDKGVDIEHTDNQGNNVFHYIADLSAESPDRSIEIFKNTVKFINYADIVRQLLTQRQNSASLTAIEYTSKFGSPALLTQMLNQPNLLQHTDFAVGKDDIGFADSKREKGESDNFTTRLEYVDVSMYECGNMTKKSTILNLLSDRAVLDMSLTDLGLFDKFSFVGKWMALKTKQTILGIGLLHAVDVIITILIVYLITFRLGYDQYYSSYRSRELNITIHELNAIGTNKSSIINEEAFHKAIHQQKFDEQIKLMSSMKFEKDQLLALYNETVHRTPSILDVYDNDITNMNITSNNTPGWVMDALFETAIYTMEEFSDERNHLIWVRYLPEMVKNFAINLFRTHKHLLHEKIDTSNRFHLQNELIDFYDNFTLTFVTDKPPFKPQEAYSYWNFRTQFCLLRKHFTTGDMIIKKGQIAPPEDLIAKYSTTCTVKALMNIANNDCKGDAESIYQEIRDMKTYSAEYWMNSMQMLRAILTLTILYLLLDLLERWVYIYTCVSCHTHVYDMMMSVLSKKVPGSYTRKQLNVLTCSSLFLYCLAQTLMHDMMDKYNIDHYMYNEYTKYFLIIGMILRFVMHIHSFRLLPGIGHFVITTFMMASNLIHFSTIYSIVLFIFAIIFNVLIDDPTCPLKKHEGFENVLQSMFSSFKLVFSHGNYDAYYTSPSVMLTYVIFVIISGLLLMNLIIAIMSTTATGIMTDPWKDTLWRIEWLDEALSVEYTFSVLTLPFSRCGCHCGYWSHKRAGYDVKIGDRRGKQKCKIFIEVFKCPALK